VFQWLNSTFDHTMVSTFSSTPSLVFKAWRGRKCGNHGVVEHAVVAFASEVWRGRRSVGRLLQAIRGVECEVWRGTITVITSEATELFEARVKTKTKARVMGTKGEIHNIKRQANQAASLTMSPLVIVPGSYTQEHSSNLVHISAHAKAWL